MFANKVVIVTGGSAGIGAAIAKCFAKEGASVAIVGRNEAKLDNVATQCENLGAKVLIIKADISKDEDAKTIVKQTINKFGKLDVLVNNAGILKYGTVAENNILQIYDEVMNTNLRSVVHISSLATPYLKESKGNIVNVSSAASVKVYPGLMTYSISKAGLDHFTRCAAADLASSGVRVNSVNPGPVVSDMLKMLDTFEAYKGLDVQDITALGRVAEGEEIGDLVLYLASDKAKSVTGSCYVIDNGALIK